MATAPSGQVMDDFENAFQACLAALTNPDYSNVQDSEEIKTGVEQTIQRFLDTAKHMECFFLQKRLLLSVQKPEHIILESNNELRNELHRKEQLLQKYYSKIQTWHDLLSDVPNYNRLLSQPVTPQPPLISLIQFPPPAPQPTPQPTPAPHHMMPPHIVQQQPMTSAASGGMMMQNPQMHPQAHMGVRQQPGGLQGPLAYLERTMSNIGSAEGGR